MVRVTRVARIAHVQRCLLLGSEPIGLDAPRSLFGSEADREAASLSWLPVFASSCQGEGSAWVCIADSSYHFCNNGTKKRLKYHHIGEVHKLDKLALTIILCIAQAEARMATAIHRCTPPSKTCEHLN